ncbi:MAG TPA: class I SAM-dependent methyltransferase [Kofleriaceae bacterium]|nr:class I SAM-dependent methyltransferase [Kofleriaceae bacterium]
MFAELGHVLRHAPATLALKRKLPQDELYAELIGRADAAGLAERRQALVEGLHGHVVEIGCGTGAMFPYYAGVEKVTGIEPDTAFADHARQAAKTAQVPIEVIEASGEHVPLPDASIDAVVLALVLCSVPSVEAVCTEIARILKSGGEVRLIEHVRSPKKIAGALMHVVNPLWLALNGQGCRLDRDPIPTLKKVGLQIDHVESFQIWSAGLPAFPMRAIFAHR